MVALGPGALARGQIVRAVPALVEGDAHVGLEGGDAGRLGLRLHGVPVREGRLGDLVVAVDLVLVGGGAVDDLDVADLAGAVTVGAAGVAVVRLVEAVADLEIGGVDHAPPGSGGRGGG